jgi:GrpB-like predicted nucleotidyltransferase (UPF0157 family)
MPGVLEKAVEERYIFKKHSSEYKKLFSSQKKIISKALRSVSKKEIHHIGSTSVPTLGGKRILDIIVVVPKKDFSKAKKLLHNAEYLYDHTMKKKRHFHKKYYVDYSGKARLVHLHLTYFGSGELIVAIAFREYLRAHKKVRKEYSKLKREASKRYSKDGKKYAKYKIKFIEKTVKKALKWHKQFEN